jgi:hypothetical protein
MLFLSLYTPAVKQSGPPTPEHLAKVGALVEKSMKDGSLVFTGPLGKSGPGGAKVRLVKGDVTITHGPFTGSVLMGASGFALLRADSREAAIQQTQEFLAAAGDGECELLQVLDGPPQA